jgi:branched-subunit amino acid transport protein
MGYEMTLNEIILIIGMFAVTFVVRYPVMALVGRLPLPEPALRALRYVPPAVLAAIILPAMVYDERGEIALRLDNEYLLAGVLAFAVAWFSKNTLVTIIVGVGALLVLKAILPN